MHSLTVVGLFVYPKNLFFKPTLMKHLSKTLTLLVLTLMCQILLAQTQSIDPENQLKRNEGSISDQFEYVITKSYTYKGNGKVYKNIQYHWLTELKASTLDSLRAIKKNLNDTKAIVAQQAKEIDDLKTNLSDTKTTLDDTNKEKDSMSLFGLQMSKTGYNILLWSIIGGLFLLLLIFIYRFNASNAATKEAKRKLDDVEVEFEDHRRVALEREQKVRRQLQDEINKNRTK